MTAARGFLPLSQGDGGADLRDADAVIAPCPAGEADPAALLDALAARQALTVTKWIAQPGS
ncbi:MAG: hypothetical protein H7Y33_02725 [Cytophagales bacterium]|nr:hypothetical protein [Rhizobacter sp.]